MLLIRRYFSLKIYFFQKHIPKNLFSAYLAGLVQLEIVQLVLTRSTAQNFLIFIRFNPFAMKYLPLVFLLVSVGLQAQRPDSLAVDPPDELQQLIEDFLQNTDSEGTFDFNTIFEKLEDFRQDPINLNKANEALLRDLRLLTDAQILDLLAYRQLAGDLISIYELQAIPGFDLATIRRILPFVTVRGSLDDYQIPLSEMLRSGRDEVFVRWSRVLESQKGFTSTTESRYLGDPNQLYVRYRHVYGTRLSFGITAEKDRGEEFFKGSNKQGFDYYSAHLFARDLNKTVKAIALGDYSVSLGQGLMVYTGFGIGKSSSPLVLKRTGRALSAYTSANEVNFFRGAATTLSFGKHLEITAFSSFKKRDANLITSNDTSNLDPEIRSFSALDLDGLHRTPSEIADEKVLNQFTVGGSVKFKNNFSHLAINALYDQFDKKLERKIQPYNLFYFNGDRLLNASVDYSLIWRNFNFFGETAMSDNGAVATINSVLIGLDRTIDFAILQRHFPKDYQALNANPFAETTGATNENGLYLGLEMRPVKNWTLSAYFDAWQHPWLRFNADAPSRGWEYRARLAYEMRRRLRAYVEVRGEVKEANAPDPENRIDVLEENQTFQARLHIENQLSKILELRSRLDWGFSQSGNKPKGSGFAVYQDILFRPIDFPLSFTARFAIFDTPGFNTRFYSFENNVLYNFSIPAYYNRGTRFYINLRYRLSRNIILEWRIAQTYWADQPSIGSGSEEITGQQRTDTSAQLRWKF